MFDTSESEATTPSERNLQEEVLSNVKDLDDQVSKDSMFIWKLFI